MDTFSCVGNPTDSNRSCDHELNEEELLSGEPCPLGCTYVEQEVPPESWP